LEACACAQVSNVWEGGAAIGGTFRVEWKRRYDLPFEATGHMHNPLNEGKPLRICRDGQELPPELGRALTHLIDQGADAAGVPPPPRPPGAASSVFFHAAALLAPHQTPRWSTPRACRRRRGRPVRLLLSFHAAALLAPHQTPCSSTLLACRRRRARPALRKFVSCSNPGWATPHTLLALWPRSG
jgi:hypothetical protein